MCKHQSTKLWKLLNSETYINTLGSLSGNHAVQHAKAGLKAIYLSGWQVAADANNAGQMYPDQSLGIESPMGPAEYGRWEEEVVDKDKVLEILGASMDHVRAVINQMSEKELNKPTRLYGREVGQWAVLLQLVTHMNEHLGQAIAYARMNQVVPPWSS